MSNSTMIPKWEVFEQTFYLDKSFDNPFIDVDLKVVLKNDGQVYTIDGFYDGEDSGRQVWRFRFAPMYEGAWQFKTVSSEEGLSGITGSFECGAPVSRGPLTVNPQYPNWFFRADGKAQWVNNDGWVPHPLFGETLPHESLEFGNPSEDEWRVYLDVLAKYDVNMLIEVDQLYARQSNITDVSFNWPWEVVDPENNKIDKDRFNLKFYQRLDRTLEYAKDRGIFYGIELLFDNSVYRPREWSAHPWNIKNGGWLKTNGAGTAWGEAFDLNNKEHVMYVERYLAYTVARTSAYWNVYWALGAECGNIGRTMWDLFAKWYGHWADYVSLHDQHGRLQSIGDTGEAPELIRHSKNHIVMTQEHSSMDHEPQFCDALNEFGERFWKYGRPMFIGEQDRYNVGKYDSERKGYWTAFVSGYYMGRVDRHFAAAKGDRFFESELLNLDGDPPIYHDLKRMAEFANTSGVRYWRMAPHDDLLHNYERGVFCLAEPNVEYVIYFTRDGNCDIELPARQSFKIQWFNPRDGQFSKSEEVTGGGKQTFSTPGKDDWVLHIVSADLV